MMTQEALQGSDLIDLAKIVNDHTKDPHDRYESFGALHARLCEVAGTGWTGFQDSERFQITRALSHNCDNFLGDIDVREEDYAVNR